MKIGAIGWHSVPLRGFVKLWRGATISAALVSSFTFSSAHACQCVTVDIDQRVADADQIFVGTVAVTEALDDGQVRTRFKLVRTLKGAGLAEITVYHLDVSGTGCELSFADLSGPTLVVARRIDGKLTTSRCLNRDVEERDIRRVLGLPGLE